jgi:hypothetical protein
VRPFISQSVKVKRSATPSTYAQQDALMTYKLVGLSLSKAQMLHSATHHIKLGGAVVGL